MNEGELGLLLTVARILRAIRSEAHDHYSGDDVRALNEALKSWGPEKGEPVDEAAA